MWKQPERNWKGLHVTEGKGATHLADSVIRTINVRLE